MAPHHLPLRRLLTAAAVALAVTLGLTLLPAAAQPRSTAVVDDYAAYEPQTSCSPTPKPAMEYLARWLVRRFGGEYGGISRACGGSRSEHKEGRAFDWTMDADDAGDQRRVARFLKKVLRTDRRGNEHALARRMGIMYIIWDDQMYAAYDRFAPKPYRHSDCRSVARCSKTLRHRDHVHISLSRAGGAAETSWYARELKRVLARRAARAQERVAAQQQLAEEAKQEVREAKQARQAREARQARRAAEQQPDLAPDLRWADDLTRPSLGFVS